MTLINWPKLSNNSEHILINQECKIIGQFKLNNIVIKQNIAFTISNLGNMKSPLLSRLNLVVVAIDNVDLDLNINLQIPKESLYVDTYLDIRVLKLNQNNKVRIIPSLEIGNKEVKAGHTATITQINQEQLAYLNQRSIIYNTAEDILINSFLNNFGQI